MTRRFVGRAMRVEDLMDRAPAALAPTASRRDAERLFSKLGVSALPIVGAAGELIGLVTRADLAKRPGAELASVMTRAPITIRAGATAADAARLFRETGVHTLPVVAEGALAGTITPLDLLRATPADGSVAPLVSEAVVPLHQDATMRAAWTTMESARQYALPVLDDDKRLVGIVADSDLFGEVPLAELHAAGLPQRPVRDIMTRAVLTVAPTDTIGEAAQRMLKARVSQLPVVENGSIRGMVTDLDLLRAWDA